MHLKLTGPHLRFFHFQFGRIVVPQVPVDCWTEAVGISYSSSLGAKLYAFEVLRPPSWTIHFGFACTVSALDSLYPQNMGVAVGIWLLFCLQAKIAGGGAFLLPLLSKTCVKKVKV